MPDSKLHRATSCNEGTGSADMMVAQLLHTDGGTGSGSDLIGGEYRLRLLVPKFCSHVIFDVLHILPSHPLLGFRRD